MGKKSLEFELDASEKSFDEEAIAQYADEEELEEERYVEDRSVTNPMQYTPLKIPDSVKDEWRKMYETVIVQDFGDDYHMTEEERKAANEFYDVFQPLLNMRKKYRNDVAGYIRYYREVIKCINAVADTNLAYPRDEFIRRVLKGKIKISGIEFPKHSGGNKTRNWDLVAQYVMDLTKDPDDLKDVSEDVYYDGLTDEDMDRIDQIIFGGDIDAFLEQHSLETIPEGESYDAEEIDPVGINMVFPMEDTTRKHMGRITSITSALAGFAKNENARRKLADYAFNLTEEDFAKIRSMDKERGSAYLEVPQFSGSVLKSSDVDKWVYQLEEYERKHVKVQGKDDEWYTIDEYEELTLKKELEDDGWNILEFYDYRKKKKQEKKEDKKIERKKKRLKKRLLEMDERRNKRKGKIGVNTKKKKHKKGGKVKSAVEAAIDKSIDEAYSSYGGFEEYMRSMEDFED